MTGEEDSKIRLVARSKLKTGYKPKAVIENLVRAGYNPDQAADAVAAEMALRQAGKVESFKVVESRKSFWNRLTAGADKVIIGIGIMAAGVALSVVTSAITFGTVHVVFIGVIAIGFATFLYGLSGGGED